MTKAKSLATKTDAASVAPDKATKRKSVKAYKEHVATNPNIVLDQSGEPLTDDNYFLGNCDSS